MLAGLRDYKVLTVGDSGVGKTQFMNCACNIAKFNEYSKATIGVSFSTRKVLVKNKLVPISIWDTAGQERYRSLTSAYFRGSHGVFLCFAVNDKLSFENLTSWNREVDKYCNANVVRMVVATKCDLDAEEWQVSDEEAQAYAASISASYLQTSAKEGHNVEFALENMCVQMLASCELQPATNGILNVPPAQSLATSSSSSCC